MLILAMVSFAGIFKVLLFVAVLSILIVLHEYGHFIFARLNGVRVLEFSVGMGPLIVATTSKKSGTQYSLRALPIGGYCAMHGEDNKTSEAGQQREFRSTVIVNGREYDDDNFQAKSAGRRLAIILAGPIANFILAFAIIIAGGVFFGITVPTTSVGSITKGYPAAKAGMLPGDVITALNGRPIRDADQLVNQIHNSQGDLRITFLHGHTSRTVTLTPVACPPPQSGKQQCIGFLEGVRQEMGASIGAILAYSGNEYSFLAGQTFNSLALLVRHPVKYAGQVSGVVGMGQAAVYIQDQGWGPYFNFAALISFALGLFNLLPLPALDGGRAAFIVGEIVRGKPVDPEKEAWVHVTGFAVLIALMVAINLNNIIQIAEGKGPF